MFMVHAQSSAYVYSLVKSSFSTCNDYSPVYSLALCSLIKTVLGEFGFLSLYYQDLPGEWMETSKDIF